MRKSHYPSVPDHWKAPFGPYVKAPAKWGGEWWFVNPFTGPEPWVTTMPEESYPEGFLEIYPKPTLEMFMAAPNPSAALAEARSMHISALADFDGLSPSEPTDEILSHLAAWDMDFEYLVYERKSIGRMIAFFGTPLGTYHHSFAGLMLNADRAIANYQVDLEQAGLHDEIKKVHWLNPPDTI